MDNPRSVKDIVLNVVFCYLTTWVSDPNTGFTGFRYNSTTSAAANIPYIFLD